MDCKQRVRTFAKKHKTKIKVVIIVSLASPARFVVYRHARRNALSGSGLQEEFMKVENSGIVLQKVNDLKMAEFTTSAIKELWIEENLSKALFLCRWTK